MIYIPFEWQYYTRGEGAHLALPDLYERLIDVCHEPPRSRLLPAVV